jgi:RNA polymerase sigma factor (sigma-70 family)
LEGNPPEWAGAGRATADTAEGNNSSIGINDRKVSKKQGRRNKLVDDIVAHYSGCGISDQDLTKAAAALLGIAKKHLKSGRDFNELVNAGMAGLAIATDKYQRGSNNGLSAYAVSWIDGEIKNFVTNSYYVVMPHKARVRNERGKHLPSGSYIEHFGNVAIGNGQLNADLSSNAELANDGEHGDDEAGGGTFLNEAVDRSLEDITGDRWWRIEQRLSERESRILLGKRRGLTNKEIGAELRTSGEAVRQALVATTRKLRHSPNEADLFAWLDRDAKVFRREFDEYCRKGIGHLYRGRQQPRMSRSLIAHNKLYVEPAWTKHKETGHCICLKCCLTRLAPGDYHVRHQATLGTFIRVMTGWAPKKRNGKDDPKLIDVAFGYEGGAAVKDERGKKRLKGKPWLHTYNGRSGHKPKQKPKTRPVPILPFYKPVERSLNFGFEIARVGRPKARGSCRPHIDCKGVPLEPIVVERNPVPHYEFRKFDDPLPPQRDNWWDKDFHTQMSLDEFMNQMERKKPWRKPTCSTLDLQCYSNDNYSKPSAEPPAITTAARPPMSARPLLRSSSGTA